MYKYQLYKKLWNDKDEILAEAKKAAFEIGITDDIKGKFGLYGDTYGMFSHKRDGNREKPGKGTEASTPLPILIDEIRELVKNCYGDKYDALPAPSGESALWLIFNLLISPASIGKGDNYRSRYIALEEKYLHHRGGYGRPFPPRYKNIFTGRDSASSGLSANCQYNTDVIFAPLVGANYSCHGICYQPCPQLVGVDPENSIIEIKKTSERHATMLAGFTSLGYDTPGYGYGIHDKNGIPLLQKSLGQLAMEYNVPYVVDNSWGLPFLGLDIRNNNAGLVVYSMDKVLGAPTSGLIIGREELIAPLRRVFTVNGDQWESTPFDDRFTHVSFNMGKEAIIGQLEALKNLFNKPDIYREAVDQTYEIVIDECLNFPFKLNDSVIITKSYNSLAVEVNYEKTWHNEELGIPIFIVEDRVAATHLIQLGLKKMGIIPSTGYDGNIFILPSQNTTDQNGSLIEDRMRLAVKGLFKLLEIICRKAGIL